jgi:hypothetical protein
MADDQTPAAIPWYQSKVLQGVVTGLVAQVVSKVQAKYNFDITVLGITVNDLVSGVMDLITLVAVGWTARARLTQKTSPQIVASQPKADSINQEAKK